jgi:hypothetical protein
MKLSQIKALREVRDGKCVGDIRETEYFKYERDGLVACEPKLVKMEGTWVLTRAGALALENAERYLADEKLRRTP